MRYITFALAKGRLAKKAMALLEEIGITCEEMKDEKTRKLIFVNEELKLKFFLSKASDVPTYVEYGAADIGVVGKDTILEEGRNLYEVLDLKFGACKMCVCGPKEAKKYLNSNEIIRVASKYPHIAKEYFNNQKLQTVEIVKLNGSVELAPIVGLSEVIVDIVETRNNLKRKWIGSLRRSLPIISKNGSESGKPEDGTGTKDDAGLTFECGFDEDNNITIKITMDGEDEGKLYAVTTDDTGYGIVLKSLDGGKDMKFLQADTDLLDLTDDRAKGLIGKWTDNSGNEYKLKKDGKLVIKSSSGETKGTYCVAENTDGTLRLNLVISGGTLEYVYTLSDDGSTVELCSPGTDTVHKWTKA